MKLIFRFDPRKGKDAAEICELIGAWASAAKKYHAGEITREEYDKWRYYYPKYDDSQITARIPSKEFSDAMVKAFKNKWID